MSPDTTQNVLHPVHFPFVKNDIKIPSATQGWNLDVWEYLPVDGESPAGAPHPVIVMGHGFTATKVLGLASFAEAFASAGYACLVFDYRTFGDSDGSPRYDLDIANQQEDYRAVVNYARSQRDKFDPARLILWGFSFAGGHCITLASEPSFQVAAVVAQCPFTQSHPSGFNFGSVKTAILSVTDKVKRFFGGERVYIPAAALPGEVGAIAAPGALEDFLSFCPEDWVNEITASVFLDIPSFAPRRSAHQIAVPILVVVGEKDILCPAYDGRDVANKAPKGEEFITKGGHFDVFPGRPFHEETLKAEIEFLKRVVPLHN